MWNDLGGGGMASRRRGSERLFDGGANWQLQAEFRAPRVNSV